MVGLLASLPIETPSLPVWERYARFIPPVWTLNYTAFAISSFAALDHR